MNCEAGGSNYEVFVAEVEGRAFEPEDETRITTHPASDQEPTWSPDGEQVAFVSDRDYTQADSAGYRADLYVANVDRSNLRRLTENGEVGIPVWGPDGRYLAFAWQIHGGEVFLYDTERETTEKMTTLKAVGRPMWRPTGQQVLVPGLTHENERVLQLISLNGELVATMDRPRGTDMDWFVSPKQ